MLKKIEKILDEKVRPSLRSHGGDVVVKEYNDGILKVKLIGACSSCPAAKATNEDLIKLNIMDELDEVKDVILVEEVSEELIDIAKKILKH